jgi:hypothetical protein
MQEMQRLRIENELNAFVKKSIFIQQGAQKQRSTSFSGAGRNRKTVV